MNAWEQTMDLTHSHTLRVNPWPSLTLSVISVWGTTILIRNPVGQRSWSPVLTVVALVSEVCGVPCRLSKALVSVCPKVQTLSSNPNCLLKGGI